MISILELTGDFDAIDSETQLNDIKYRLLIKHDFVKKTIEEMFSIYFLDENNMKSEAFIMNEWKISSFGVENYFGRARLYASVFDPNNKFVEHFDNGAYTLISDEERNVEQIKCKIIDVLKKLKRFSYFKDSISRIEYVEAFRKENKGNYDDLIIKF